MESTGVLFRPPSLLKPKNMLALSFDNVSGEFWENKNGTVFPPKSVHQILDLLKQEKWSEISIIEWIYLIESDYPWQSDISQNELNQIAVYVLKAIVSDRSVQNLVIFRAALAIESESNLFPKILLNEIELLLEYLNSENDKLRVRLLVNARNNNFLEVAKSLQTMMLTPGEFLTKVNLVKCTNLYLQICAELPNALSEVVPSQHEEWLIRCLYELNLNYAIQFLNYILCHVGGIKEARKLNDWLKEHCDPSLENSLWFFLNTEAKANLRKLIPVNDFVYARQLARVLTSESVAHGLELDESVVKQIKARELFWSHYEESFLSVSVYVPSQTQKVLEEINLNTEWMETLTGNDEGSEVIIFELAKYIIVEFLRGGTSEVRIYPNNQRHANLLLRKQQLSISQIKQTFEVGVHDHVFLWQWSCERWLRTEYGVLPDKRVRKFLGLPPSSNRYDPVVGLPTPPQQLLQQRQEQLEKWNTDYLSVEAKNKNFSEKELEIYRCKQKARQFKTLGQDLEMSRELERASLLGDIDSTERLAKWLLTKPSASKAERFRGEKLLKLLEIYDGKVNIPEQHIRVYETKDTVQQTITNRPIRRVGEGIIGVNFKSQVYELFIDDDKELAIFLGGACFETEDCPAIRAGIHVKGLGVRLDIPS